MRIPEAIYKTVSSFDPVNHPWFALAALMLIMLAVVAIALFAGTGTTAFIDTAKSHF